MKPFIYVKWEQNSDGTSTAYFMCGELTPDDETWKPLYEHPPCAHCAPPDADAADEIPGPAPESMAEGD